MNQFNSTSKIRTRIQMAVLVSLLSMASKSSASSAILAGSEGVGPSRPRAALTQGDTLSQALDDHQNRINSEFKVPAFMKANVKFWMKIYTQYTTRQLVLFDAKHPEIVYGSIDFDDLVGKSRNRAAYELNCKMRRNRILAEYRLAFKHLQINPHPRRPSVAEQAILRAVGRTRNRHHFKELEQSFHTQLGQKDNVIRAISIAQDYLPRMESIFEQNGLPKELTRLAFVESSFDSSAKSKVGAVGVWQFMEFPGKKLLHIDETNEIDERRSPLKATVAAAKLFKENYDRFGNWPLSIMAYQHGLRDLPTKVSMPALGKELRRLLASCEIHSQTGVSNLGWASRNYLAEFYALTNAYAYRDYFYGDVSFVVDAPSEFTQLSEAQSIAAIALDRQISVEDLRRLNPDIQNLFRPLPKGFWINLPAKSRSYASYTSTIERNSEASPASSLLNETSASASDIFSVATLNDGSSRAHAPEDESFSWDL